MANLTAIWHSNLACTSPASSLHRSNPGANNLSPLSARASLSSVAERLHSASTQWSSARTPVDSQWNAGVVAHSAGSRITRLAPMPECRKPIFCLVASLVPPARAKYSPPERVVGMQIRGIAGREMCKGGLGAPRAKGERCEGVEMLFARHWFCQVKYVDVGGWIERWASYEDDQLGCVG